MHPSVCAKSADIESHEEVDGNAMIVFAFYFVK